MEQLVINGILLSFDIVMAITIVTIVMGALAVRNHFQAIVLFIVFGLLMAIVWCRLDAVDLALAEAAIGAGLTGALFLVTLAATRDEVGSEEQGAGSGKQEAKGRGRLQYLATTLAVSAAAGVATIVLAWIAAGLVMVDDAPRIDLRDALPVAGATNPVTAVLLNVRAYDTLMEVAVLVVAAFAVISLSTERRLTVSGRSLPAPGPVLAMFMRIVSPLIVLAAAYLLWAGSKSPGGAFQAGALASAAGVLLLVTGGELPAWIRRLANALLLLGLVVFLSVGVGALTFGRFLEYRGRPAEVLVLIVETALAVSIAWILLVLFAGGTLRTSRQRTAVPAEEQMP